MLVWYWLVQLNTSCIEFQIISILYREEQNNIGIACSERAQTVYFSVEEYSHRRINYDDNLLEMTRFFPWWVLPILICSTNETSPSLLESVSNWLISLHISNIFPIVVSDLDPTATAFLICYILDQAGNIAILELY